MMNALGLVFTTACILIGQEATDALPFCPNISALWWENEPYVHLTQNKISGGLPRIFQESAKVCCKNAINVDWTGKLASYEAGLESISAPPPGNASMNGSNVQVWLPFSLLRIEERSQKIQKELFSTYQLVVFTNEDTSDKIIKMYNGFKRIFSFIMITLLITIFFGFLIWLAETRSNERQFPKPFYRGAWHGFWWAIVTITTVGYGDKSPKTGIGKFVGIIWMSLSLVLYPAMTAEMASIMTDSTFSLALKKMGALKNSAELKEASNAGAIVKECETYRHCLELLNDKKLDGIVVNLHAAQPLRKSNTNLIVRSTIAKKIPVNAVYYSRDQNRINPFIDCIQKNSMLVIHSMMHGKEVGVLQVSTAAMFTTGGRDLALYLTGAVVAMWVVLFIIDYAMTRHKRKQRIGNFREGVFIGNTIPNNEEPTIELAEKENFNEKLALLITVQKKHIQEMQEELAQLEKKMAY